MCHKTWHATFNFPTRVLCQDREEWKMSHTAVLVARNLATFGIWIDFFAVDGWCQLFFNSVACFIKPTVNYNKQNGSIWRLNKTRLHELTWTGLGERKFKSNQETLQLKALALKKKSKGVETMETPLATSVRSTTSTGWSEVQGDGVHESSLHSLLISASVGYHQGLHNIGSVSDTVLLTHAGIILYGP